jgi:hypothetical protein
MAKRKRPLTDTGPIPDPTNGWIPDSEWCDYGEGNSEHTCDNDTCCECGGDHCCGSSKCQANAGPLVPLFAILGLPQPAFPSITKDLPVPPKFHTPEEAEAWLEANAR